MHMEAQAFFDEGYIFGEEGEGFERINLACPTHKLEGMLERVKKAVEKVK
jgi:bifunctional pyridoxal-dependent enzyme with beta-cystathionase and maltose regulon repressor activities